MAVVVGVVVVVVDWQGVLEAVLVFGKKAVVARVGHPGIPVVRGRLVLRDAAVLVEEAVQGVKLAVREVSLPVAGAAVAPQTQALVAQVVRVKLLLPGTKRKLYESGHC